MSAPAASRVRPTPQPLTDSAAVREFGIGFVDAEHGWVGAVPHGFVTTDGGATWEKAEMGQAVNKIRVLHTPRGPVAYGIGVQVLKWDGRQPTSTDRP